MTERHTVTPTEQRYRIRTVRDGHWIEGTYTASSREEAVEIARSWAEKWQWGRGRVTVEDGQT